MHNKFAVLLLINLILFGAVYTNPQFYSRFPYQTPNVHYRDRINRNTDNVPPYLRSSFQHSPWKRNSRETYSSYQADDSSIYFNQKRPDNGSFKILNVRSTSREQSDIVFPDQNYGLQQPSVPVLGDKSPCGGANSFCESVTNYPADYIEQILKNSVVNFSDYLPKDDNPVEVGQRVNIPGEESLCQSYTDIYRPQSAENKYGKWLFVVNQENYIQEIQMEVCNGTEEKCKFTENFPNGYETVCKQKYVYRKLYALDENSKKIVMDSFKLPSCCSCVVRFVGDISNRSAFPTSFKAASSDESSKKTASSHSRRSRAIKDKRNTK